MKALTHTQQQAIAARGNVLVKAGAGTGKTRTLVEACLARVCDPDDPVSLDQILMVTFTEAAAAEMRLRLRLALEQKAAEIPNDDRLVEQLALVDTARISTLHSFCLQLLREHFYALALDPQIVVLAEEQSRVLAAETLDELLNRQYAAATPAGHAVQNLILAHGRGADQPVRALVLKVHHYTQTLANPDGWFEQEQSLLQRDQPMLWESWLETGFHEWVEAWLAVVTELPLDNIVAHRCAAILQNAPRPIARSRMAEALEKILATDNCWPDGKKTKMRGPLEKMYDEAAFLFSVASPSAGQKETNHTPASSDPLTEDWNWVRPIMTALLQLTHEFGVAFGRAKQELGAVDFQDLEQMAVRLLWDLKKQAPTPVAIQWREKLRLVYVDEYQDINEAQDAILKALSREGEKANRFLVGDVKQSIYRFRLANPHVFQAYASDWQAQPQLGKVISLNDNFRSHEALLQFVNAIFTGLMQHRIGGVEYDQEAQLRFGVPLERPERAMAADHSPEARVELHLLLTRKTGNADSDLDENDTANAAEMAEMSRAEREARLVAWRLQNLKAQPYQVWDEQSKSHRAVEWRDMVILLRSPRGKAESYAKEFARLGIPLLARRSGFYECTEISDLVCMLRLLDNPLQDLPLLAVLRSPLAGLTLDELAAVRLSHRHGYFWTALQRFQQETHETNGVDASRKISRFLQRYDQWRALARQVPLSQCLESVLDDTLYPAWLTTQPQAAQRQANVQRLLVLTRQFDPYQRQGLYRFLKLVDSQLETEVDKEPAPATVENAVRLMSIHQSKGLEFPIVVVADLGKRFNYQDFNERIILDEHYGLCPLVQPPHTARYYPSLPYWLARRRQIVETLGEEVRLLYVALTRAGDKLILTGSVSVKTTAETWAQAAKAKMTPQQILAAKSALDWLGHRLTAVTGCQDWTTNGRTELLEWKAYRETIPLGATIVPRPNVISTPQQLADLASLQARLSWEYPYLEATQEPAKASVSALRRLANEQADETRPFFEFEPPASQFAVKVEAPVGKSALSAAEIGTAHHSFLEWVALDRTHSVVELQQEAERLEKSRILKPDERQALDYAGMASLWQSEIGQLIRRHAPQVHREIPFTARFSLADLARLKFHPLPTLNQAQASLDQTRSGLIKQVLNAEFVVVQGVVDLAVIRPSEIWLMDYKTDQVNANGLEEKVNRYRPQIALYALALSRIYQVPVTRRWLYFITLRRSVPVDFADPTLEQNNSISRSR